MYSHKTQVTASHTGADGYQTPVSVLSMLQDCSQLWLDSEPVVKRHLEENRLAMLLASRQVDFLQKAPYATRLTARTGVYNCNGYMGYRNTALYGLDDTLYARSWSAGIFASLETGRPTRLPKVVQEAITYDEKLQMDYLDKRISIPSSDPRIFPGTVAQRSDIDFNQHVNNTQYIRMACEYLPEDATINRLRVEYKSAAKQGDVLVPHVYGLDSGTVTVVLFNEREGIPFAVIEFT